MRTRNILAALLLTAAGLQTALAQKLVLNMKNGDKIDYYLADVDSVNFVDLEGADFSCPDGHHPHAINLGLDSGTKWCCCNVGAGRPDEFGNYFAWGETKPKDTYNTDWSNYFDTDDDGSSFKKYYHYWGGEKTLLPDDDAATSNMGEPWLMPTYNQMMELKNSCRSEWTVLNNVHGVLMTGPNGNSIFLPSAGQRWNDQATEDNSWWGYYWSSSLKTDMGSSWSAYGLSFTSGDWVGSSFFRYNGQSVRAVCP